MNWRQFVFVLDAVRFRTAASSYVNSSLYNRAVKKVHSGAQFVCVLEAIRFRTGGNSFSYCSEFVFVLDAEIQTRAKRDYRVSRRRRRRSSGKCEPEMYSRRCIQGLHDVDVFKDDGDVDVFKGT